MTQDQFAAFLFALPFLFVAGVFVLYRLAGLAFPELNPDSDS